MKNPTKSGRRARRKAETRERILEAAMDLFDRQTYLETTIEQITDIADVGKGTFFNYFPTKEQVLAQSGTLNLEGAGASAEEGSVREAWKQVYLSSAAFPRRSRSILRNMIVAHLATESAQKQWSDDIGQKCRVLSDWARRGQSQGEIRRDLPVEKISFLFVQSLLGAILGWSMWATGTLPDWLEASFDHFWQGISTHPVNGKALETPQPKPSPSRHLPDAFPWMK